MESYKLYWDMALKELQVSVSPISYNTYIVNLKPIDVIGTKLILATVSETFASEVAARLHDKIREALKRTNTGLTDIELYVGDSKIDYLKRKGYSSSEEIGRVFADGNVYDNKGVAVDKIYGDGYSFYNSVVGKILPLGNVSTDAGDKAGFINYDGTIVDRFGKVLGKADTEGRWFSDKGEYLGALVKTGAAIGYDGSYIGYVLKNGIVVNQQGQTVAYENGSGLVFDSNHKVLGERIEELPVVDLFGVYRGYINALGELMDLNGSFVTFVLPGGITDKNLSVLKRGTVIDFAGNIIGSVLPDGTVVNTKNVIIGSAYPDGKVSNDEGRIIGEIVSGDIAINNQDKIMGFVSFDGTIKNSDGGLVGKALSSGLAVDNQNNVVGTIYKIGTAILSGDGQYLGYLNSKAKVVSVDGKEIGYLKSNGSFINLDKQVAGYALQEVAQNRRN